MATTGGSDFETVLAQIVAAVEVDDTDVVKELLPQLIAADDNLSSSQNLAFSPLAAAHDNATNIVAGFADAYNTTSRTKQDSSGQRGLLYSNLLDYLLEPSEPATKQAVLEQAGFVLQANSAKPRISFLMGRGQRNHPWYPHSTLLFIDVAST